MMNCRCWWAIVVRGALHCVSIVCLYLVWIEAIVQHHVLLNFGNCDHLSMRKKWLDSDGAAWSTKMNPFSLMTFAMGILWLCDVEHLKFDDDDDVGDGGCGFEDAVDTYHCDQLYCVATHSPPIRCPHHFARDDYDFVLCLWRLNLLTQLLNTRADFDRMMIQRFGVRLADDDYCNLARPKFCTEINQRNELNDWLSLDSKRQMLPSNAASNAIAQQFCYSGTCCSGIGGWRCVFRWCIIQHQ